ncbi:hypothetical protein E4U54_005938, partial [Claviceps lovelessii]
FCPLGAHAQVSPVGCPVEGQAGRTGRDESPRCSSRIQHGYRVRIPREVGQSVEEAARAQRGYRVAV